MIWIEAIIVFVLINLSKNICPLDIPVSQIVNNHEMYKADFRDQYNFN